MASRKRRPKRYRIFCYACWDWEWLTPKQYAQYLVRTGAP